MFSRSSESSRRRRGIQRLPLEDFFQDRADFGGEVVRVGKDRKRVICRFLLSVGYEGEVSSGGSVVSMLPADPATIF